MRISNKVSKWHGARKPTCSNDTFSTNSHTISVTEPTLLMWKTYLFQTVNTTLTICKVLTLYGRKYFAARISYFHVWWCLNYAQFCGIILPGGLYKSRRTSKNQVYFILQEGLPQRRYSKNEIQLLLKYTHPLSISISLA